MTKRLTHNNFNHLNEVFADQKQRARDENWLHYQIFGLNMASNYPFGDRLLSGLGEVNVVFTCQNEAPISIDWDEIEPVYTSNYHTVDGKSFKYLYKQDNLYIIRYTNWIDFYLLEDCIIGHILEESLKDAHVINLLPNALSFWLELQGIPCLHAAAIVVNDYAVAFLANSGQGKSTLTATFLQTGYPLLTDDKLPVEQKEGTFWGRSSFPLLRIHQDVAARIDVDYEEWDLVMPGFTKRVAHVEHDVPWEFCHTSKRFAAIYILERLDAETQKPITTISKIPPRDAAIELVRFDFNTRINAALGFSVARLGFFSQLAKNVPVRRVAYMAGHKYLPDVQIAVLQDLRETNLIFDGA